MQTVQKGKEERCRGRGKVIRDLGKDAVKASGQKETDMYSSPTSHFLFIRSKIFKASESHFSLI